MTTKSVLIVDDVPDIVRFVETTMRRLRGHDLEITTTTHAEQAVALAREKRFDVVLADYRMPHATGLQVLASAREKDPTGHRALMTGYNELPASAPDVEAAGLDAFMFKPIRMNDLIDLLGALLADDAHALDEYRKDAGERVRAATAS